MFFCFLFFCNAEVFWSVVLYFVLITIVLPLFTLLCGIYVYIARVLCFLIAMGWFGAGAGFTWSYRIGFF